MKLSAFTNEDAIDVLADLIEPAGEIFSDAEVLKSVRDENTKMATTVKLALKKHKASVVEILAVLNGQTVDEYSGNPITILKDCLEVMNDKELKDFFYSQVKMMADEPSILPAVNTKEKEQ